MKIPEECLLRSEMLQRLHGVGLVLTEISNKVISFKKLPILFIFMLLAEFSVNNEICFEKLSRLVKQNCCGKLRRSILAETIKI